MTTFRPRLPARLAGATLKALLAVALGLAASMSAAQAPEGGPPEGGPPGGPGAGGRPTSSWGIGIGGGSKQTAYTGIARDHQVLPLLEYENPYLRVLGPAVEVKAPPLALTDTQSLNFRAVARYAIFGGYEADDAPILNGMDERKDGIWAGLKLEWKTSVLNLSGEWLHDVSNHSQGQRFSLVLDKPFRLSPQVMVAPRIGVTWHDAKYNDFYFGVTAAEAQPWRPAYQAGAGISPEAGLRSIFLIDRSNSLMLDLWVSGLSSEVKNSPLVDRSTENRIFLAYVYRF